MVESYNPASLMVSWRPPTSRDRNGPITGYTINYTMDGSSDVMSINVTGDTSVRTVTISELAPYVNYSVSVAAMTVNGTGAFSGPPVVNRSGEDGELNSLLVYVCTFISQVQVEYHCCYTYKNIT